MLICSFAMTMSENLFTKRGANGNVAREGVLASEILKSVP